jgi:hypothetical protein
VRNFTGNPPYIGTIGSFVIVYNFIHKRLPKPTLRNASRRFCVKTGITGCKRKKEKKNRCVKEMMLDEVKAPSNNDKLEVSLNLKYIQYSYT